MNQVMALAWTGTGAALLGLAAAVGVRRRAPGSIPMALPVLLALGAFLVTWFWLSVAPVHAWSRTIDAARPGDVTCESALGALEGSPFVVTDAGPRFSPAFGACQAAAWRRVASFGSAEVGMAAVLAAGTLHLVRRRGTDGVRESQPAAATQRR